MLLNELSVENFRVFDGQHTFDLQPRVKRGKKPPIILFGGLNGAGKTSILTAVRLALYGKQSLGRSVTKNQYQDYLRKAIHRSRDDTRSPTTAHIELSFEYASMGLNKKYVVRRAWDIRGQKSVNEQVTISEDGVTLNDLNTEQCQGFLNELIPIGVSDLFFFDGEKIAELADDTSGEALGDAIKKLLGLDLIETLNQDLSIVLRSEAKKGQAADQQKRINQLEDELREKEAQADKEIAEYEQTLPTEKEVTDTLSRLETLLSSKGGAWASTRESAIQEQSALTEEKKILEAVLRELASEAFPFSLAPVFIERTLDQLRDELDITQRSRVADAVSDRISSLQNDLKTVLQDKTFRQVNELISKEFDDLLKVTKKTLIIHDLSERAFARVESVLTNAQEANRQKMLETCARLDEISEQLDRAGARIARAPEEAQLKPILDEIGSMHARRASIRTKQRKHLEAHKRLLREAVDIARQLEKAYSDATSEEEAHRTTTYASNTVALLKDFSTEMAKRKVRDLESEFVQSFHRLARKGDVDLHASIDPTNFSVTLHRGNGDAVDKNELSAGEKQIFAISILEALARTSGRNLPIIIDTPLGRLDSIHRSKLIKSYFPQASHQVIILSTDTEVDEAFYKALSPSISHAFKLEYEPKTGSTKAFEGYFWREQKRMKAV